MPLLSDPTHDEITMSAVPTTDGLTGEEITMWSWRCSCGDGSALVDNLEVAGQEADEHVETGRSFAL